MSTIIDIIIPISICIIAYFCGLFSTARVFAKAFKHLKLSKVGSGHLDTENIFSNVSRPLGVMVGLIDIAKMYAFLYLVKYIVVNVCHNEILATSNLLFIYGFFVILGHCFPFYNKFKGGRGIFTFAGYIGFFAPVSMFIVGVIATIISLGFKQNRAAKYFTVGAPVIASLITTTIMKDSANLTTKIFMASVLMALVNLVVSRKRKEL